MRTGAPRTIRIRARPDTIHVSHGRTVLATARDGLIARGSSHGLFVDETRMLSLYRYRIDGREPEPNVLSTIDAHTFLGYWIVLAPGADAAERDHGSGQVPLVSQHPIELRAARSVGEGFREELTLTNYSDSEARFTFEIELEADFADQSALDVPFAVERTGHGFICPEQRRGIEIRFSKTPPFAIVLQPKESWQLTIDFVPSLEHRALQPDGHERTRIFLDEATKFDAPGAGLTAVVMQALEQAKYDLASLRLFDLDDGPRAWTMAAGLPLYIALFGRDTLTAGWQASMLGPEMMKGALAALAKTQGTTTDDWRDEQPGRMLHEAHTGPLSALNRNPRGRSYGSITTSGLFPFIAAELWHWTGDPDAVRPLIDPALRALEWLDRYGDRDGDGLYEYLTRSKDGVKHQAWKDSPDAIVYPDGAGVEPPIATCEEQGFVYIAKLHFSETLWALGMHDEARRLFAEAAALKRKFNEAFWMEEEGFYALALDADKRQVRSIASNAGHCVATAIADDEHVPRVVARLFRDDLFSGWGIRTLSRDHPRYNPYSYHLGSIWPVEHGTFALGFMRYGLHDRVEQIARAQFEAASLFDFCRLPELFGGHPRDDAHPFPAIYPGANSPQAWSASMVFSLLQAMLGLYPYAPLRVLLVDPHLPDWLPEITLRDLRVGDATVTIRFKGNSYRVLRKKGKLHVLKQPTPWSLTATTGERLRDWLTSLLPGR